ncbi:uncharacterized protein B0H64DRAFT_148940 [Chaetomium fimeti]|uniref:Uncharacterized protein n=1 Tax=Chaetomium fimeti TaxID=1854472 RepID=A0AAE0HFF6_9PEZI|nr:hypothetical protein B0H64DRAFT_148940 [Chaetomium fimeti]
MELCAPPGAQTSFSCRGLGAQSALQEPGRAWVQETADCAIRPMANKPPQFPKHEERPRPNCASHIYRQVWSKISGYSSSTAPRGTAGSWSQGGHAAVDGNSSTIRRHRSLQGSGHGAASAKTSRPPLSAPRRQTSNTRTTGPQSSSSLSHLTLVTARGEDVGCMCGFARDLARGWRRPFPCGPTSSRYEKRGLASAPLLVSNVAGGCSPDMCVCRPKKRFRFPASHR